MSANAVIAIGNKDSGIALADAKNNVIRDNVISGNGAAGVYIFGAQSYGNVVSGNFIGTNAFGTGPVVPDVAAPGNTYDRTGVVINHAHENVIGGTTAADRNIISGNLNCGVFVTDNFSTGQAFSNLIRGNFIGTNAAGTLALPNNIGISVRAGATNSVIGGTAKGREPHLRQHHHRHPGE